MNILLIGNGAREHAIAEATMRSGNSPRLFAYMKINNPGIAALAEKVRIGGYNDLKTTKEWARENRIHFAVIGPEDPLHNGWPMPLLRKGSLPSAPQKASHGLKHPKPLPEISCRNTAYRATPDSGTSRLSRA